MAKNQKKQQTHKPTEYELLCQRIQRAINSPRAQREGTVVIAQGEELQENWERMLEDLDTIEEVTLEQQEGGEVRLSWTPPEKD